MWIASLLKCSVTPDANTSSIGRLLEVFRAGPGLVVSGTNHETRYRH